MKYRGWPGSEKKGRVQIYDQDLGLNDWGNGRGCYSRGPHFPILQASKEGTFAALAKKGEADHLQIFSLTDIVS